MKIIYQGETKTGKDIIIRYPQKGDEKMMWQYINELSKEKTFVRFQGENILLDDETKYLESQLKKINNKSSVTLLAFWNDKLIAISDINMRDKTEKHVGVFGISVAKVYRNEGIGKFLMEKIFEEAKKEIPDIKIVTLEVYAKNSIARRIYENFGFMEYGMLPNGIIREDGFDNALLMYKNI